MAGPIFSWVNRLASAQLGASAQATLLPADNVQRMPVGKVWRALANSAYLDFDLGAAMTMQYFTARGVNLTASGTWRLQVSAVAAGADELLDTGTLASGVQAGYPHVYYDHTAELTARYLRVSFADATLGHLDVGYLHAGPGWRSTRAFDYGARVRWADEADRERSLGGQPLNSSRGRYRLLNFQIANNTPAEMIANALELQRQAGLAGNVLVRLDPDSYPQEWSAYGQMQQIDALGWDSLRRMPQQFSIEDRT